MHILFDTSLQAVDYNSIGAGESFCDLLNTHSRRPSLVIDHPVCAKFNTPQFTTFMHGGEPRCRRALIRSLKKRASLNPPKASLIRRTSTASNSTNGFTA